MANTVTTSAAAYLSAADLFTHCDWRLVADWASESGDGPRPTRAALLDATSPAGAVVAEKLKAASGKLESACLRGGLYAVADLQSLTGSTLSYLKEVVAGLAVLGFAGRRQPGSADPKQVPAAQTALDALEALRLGERIFGLADQVAAGAGPEAVTFVDTDDTRNTVNAASRYFGRRNDRGG